jgi:hypothetical protein
MERMERVRAEVQTIRTGLQVNRLHYIYSIRTPDSFREEYSYLFSGHEGLSALPLYWHSRNVQANMLASDASGCRVQTLPSARVREYSAELLRELIDEFIASQPESDRPTLILSLADLQLLLKFEISPQEKDRAAKCIAPLQATNLTNPSFRKLVAFADQLMGFYLPLVAVPKDAGSEFLEIRHGVDLNIPFADSIHSRRDDTHPAKQGFWDWFRFVAIGSTAFEMGIPIEAASNPPWFRTDSLHLQLNLPAGVAVRERPEVLPAASFSATAINRFTSVSADYVYSYLTAQDARKVRERYESLSAERDRAKEKYERDLRDNLAPRRKPGQDGPKGPGDASVRTAPLPHGPVRIGRDLLNFLRLNRKVTDAKRPRIRVKANVDNGVRLLGIVLWIVVGLTYSLQILGLLSLGGYLDLFAALLLVVLTLAVYSLDKPFVQYPVFSHVAAATVVFFELAGLVRYGGQLASILHVG